MTFISVDDILDSLDGEHVIHIRESSKYPIVVTCDSHQHYLFYVHETEIRFRVHSTKCQCTHYQEALYEKWND